MLMIVGELILGYYYVEVIRNFGKGDFGDWNSLRGSGRGRNEEGY